MKTATKKKIVEAVKELAEIAAAPSVEAAAAIASPPAPINRIIPLACILPSATNPRKQFSEGIDELAQSIAAQGVLQPVTLRRLWRESQWVWSDNAAAFASVDAQGNPGPWRSPLDMEFDRPAIADGRAFEIILGERRCRAAVLAGLEEVPAIVVDWSDAQICEAQIVENLQREDLTPLEEAAAYQGLVLAGYTAEKVAHQCGKSISYVRGRMRLLELPEAARHALANGDISPTVALEISFIADEADQADIAALVIESPAKYDAAAIKRLARQRYRDLKVVQWDKAAPMQNLRPCEGCPHALTQETTTGTELLCQRASCYSQKVDMIWRKAESQAELNGWKIVKGVASSAISYTKGNDRECPASANFWCPADTLTQAHFTAHNVPLPTVGPGHWEWSLSETLGWGRGDGIANGPTDDTKRRLGAVLLQSHTGQPWLMFPALALLAEIRRVRADWWPDAAAAALPAAADSEGPPPPAAAADVADWSEYDPREEFRKRDDARRAEGAAAAAAACAAWDRLDAVADEVFARVALIEKKERCQSSSYQFAFVAMCAMREAVAPGVLIELEEGQELDADEIGMAPDFTEPAPLSVMLCEMWKQMRDCTAAHMPPQTFPQLAAWLRSIVDTVNASAQNPKPYELPIL